MMPDAARTGDVIITPNFQFWSTNVDDPLPALIGLTGSGILGALVGTALWLIGRPDRL
jgi:hypothetical protein